MERSIEHVERSVPHVFKLVFSNNREVHHVPSMTFRLLDDSWVRIDSGMKLHQGSGPVVIVVEFDLIHPP